MSSYKRKKEEIKKVQNNNNNTTKNYNYNIKVKNEFHTKIDENKYKRGIHLQQEKLILVIIIDSMKENIYKSRMIIILLSAIKEVIK